MTTAAKLLNSLLIATLLCAASAHAADDSILVAMEDGKSVAQFKVGDSRCVLKDDVIRCIPVGK
ncbi:MAG: hypothetical protein ABI612_08030 [Betaproteobacteria bacterium]